MNPSFIIKEFAVFAIISLMILSIVNAYTIEEPDEVVHQHITNESKLVWKLIPYEILLHLTNPINEELDGQFRADFDEGDDIITGSGEDDRDFWVNIVLNANHFWQPDDPQNGRYDNGLVFLGSSYKRAQNFWINEMIPAYLRGDYDEAYYWLGRVAHLLEDAAQPSHVHNDPHLGHGAPSGASVIEDYTADNFNRLRTAYVFNIIKSEVIFYERK